MLKTPSSSKSITPLNTDAAQRLTRENVEEFAQLLGTALREIKKGNTKDRSLYRLASLIKRPPGAIINSLRRKVAKNEAIRNAKREKKTFGEISRITREFEQSEDLRRDPNWPADLPNILTMAEFYASRIRLAREGSLSSSPPDVHLLGYIECLKRARLDLLDILQTGASSKQQDGSPFYPSKWFDENTTVSGNTIRQAIHTGENIRKRPMAGRKKKQEYSLPDVQKHYPDLTISDATAAVTG